MHPFNIRKEDKCNLSVFALWRQAKRKLFAGLWGSLSFYAAKASRMFVNATLHNLELNIGNLAASACVNWMIYLQPIKIEYMKKEMKNRRRTCSDCMTRSSILESVSTWEKRIERDCVGVWYHLSISCDTGRHRLDEVRALWFQEARQEVWFTKHNSCQIDHFRRT